MSERTRLDAVMLLMEAVDAPPSPERVDSFRVWPFADSPDLGADRARWTWQLLAHPVESALPLDE